MTTTSLPGIRVHEDVEPTFIVGSVRSGTSITMNAMKLGAKLPGFDEGNVASMVQRMLDRIEDYDGEHTGSESTDELKARLINWVGDLYVETMGRGAWFDKSPESYLTAPMIRFCPLLLEIFPKAKFIFCIRRGIENILSRQRKFAGIPFKSYCQSWADAVEQWVAVRDQLKGRYVEAHQHEIAIRPDKVAREIAETLSLSDAQRRGIEDIFTNKRFEQSRFATEHRWLALDDTSWSDDERVLFREICGSGMEAMGYPMEGQTLAAAGPIRLFYPVVETSVARQHVIEEEWGFCKMGETGLQLHPNGPGEPTAEVRYLDVPLNGHSGIQASLEVPKGAAAPVVFSLRVERAGGSEALAEVSCEVAPGKKHRWEASFPAVDGQSDVIIGTRMADGAGSNEGAGAIWEDARLTPGAE